MSDVRLIQVPYYLGREHANLSRGPAKLADAIGGESVVIEPPRPDVLPNEVAESFSVIRGVASAVRETVEEGRFPLVLAVNCFTSLGTVAGVGRDVGVVWFDAHGDFHTPGTTTSGFLDGMGLAMLLGDGWRELRNTVEGLRPVPAEHALLVGARDIDPTEQSRVDASPLRRDWSTRIWKSRWNARIRRLAYQAPIQARRTIDRTSDRTSTRVAFRTAPSTPAAAARTSRTKRKTATPPSYGRRCRTRAVTSAKVAIRLATASGRWSGTSRWRLRRSVTPRLPRNVAPTASSITWITVPAELGEATRRPIGREK